MDFYAIDESALTSTQEALLNNPQSLISDAGGPSGSSSAISLKDDNDKVTQTENTNAKLLRALDFLDGEVEKFRKNSLSLQERRDYLLLLIDLMKNDNILGDMSESDRDEIVTYMQRVEARLATVDIYVRTMRDAFQVDSLFQVNALIDTMITLGDPAFSRQRCQLYLNACCSSLENCDGNWEMPTYSVKAHVDDAIGRGDNDLDETDPGPVDKKFESVLLGCTLDDQKTIKKRLQGLMIYLNKQIVSNSVEANITISRN